MDGPPGRQAKPCQQTRSGAGRCTPACRPGSPELSKSYMDMASKLLTFTFALTHGVKGHTLASERSAAADTDQALLGRRRCAQL